MDDIERCRAELDRIRDALAGADVGQDEGLAFEVATLQAAWEEMHREARGAVEVLREIAKIAGRPFERADEDLYGRVVIIGSKARDALRGQGLG